MKKKTSSNKQSTLTLSDYVTFSIVSLPVDNEGSPIPVQRILQTVSKEGVTKQYVTESAYFRGECYQNLSTFIETSYENSIGKRKPALTAIKGGRYWIHFSEEIETNKKQKRVNPENFE